jgi:hypothetical protein
MALSPYIKDFLFYDIKRSKIIGPKPIISLAGTQIYSIPSIIPYDHFRFWISFFSPGGFSMIQSPQLEARYRDAELRSRNQFTPSNITIPIEAAINPFLSNTEKLLFGWIANTAASSWGCQDTNERLAEKMGKCPQTITNCISKLKQFQYIDTIDKREGYDHSSRTILVDLSYPQRYMEAKVFYYDNYGSINLKELNEKLKPIIEACRQNQGIRKFIYWHNQGIKNFIPNNSISTSIVMKPFTDNKKKLSVNRFHIRPTDVSVSSTENLPPGDIQLDLPLEQPKLPVSRFNRPAKLTPKPVTSPTVKQASVAMDKMFCQMAKDERAARREKKKQTPFQSIPQEIRIMMESWKSLGFKIPNPETAPNTYNKAIRALKKIQTGTLIPGEERKFNPDDINNAMLKFSQIVFDPDYGPKQPVKDQLAKMSLEGFLFNAYGRNIRSWFLKCHEEELKKKSEMIEDKCPEVTNRLKGYYERYPLAGMKKRFTESEENKFRFATARIVEFYDKKKHRMSGITRGYHEIADLLCEAIRKQYGDKVTNIHPGSFASSFAFSCLIKLMNEQGYFTDYQATNVDGY